MASSGTTRTARSATANASEEGEYWIRVPYATSGYPGLLKFHGVYTLACRGEALDVSIDERQVQEGLTVRVPDLCIDPARESDRR